MRRREDGGLVRALGGFEYLDASRLFLFSYLKENYASYNSTNIRTLDPLKSLVVRRL